ncbi:MAG: hypothetical protein FRX49_13766 [Trebouxia sp. A1-2]|nr:MAG: hypothetical protein FRX49_13766 [Trebouxia sp. A1-2]
MASVYAPVERQERAPFFQQCLLPAMPVGTPLLLGGDWNCVADNLDLVGGQPGTRQHGFRSGLLPFQQALGLQDAFRCLHPQAKEFTYTATNNASSARIDRWLVSDGLLPSVSAASVSDLILSDHYGVAITVSPADAPPRGPGLWSMPSAIISHPAFKTLMTAQIQTFLQANAVTTALSRAARWDQLKVHIQDVARNYCSTFHAERTRQLRVLRVRASKARAAYMAAPDSHHALDALRDTAAALLQHGRQQAATDALRAGVLLHEYGDQSTYYFHHLHGQRQQATAASQQQFTSIYHAINAKVRHWAARGLSFLGRVHVAKQVLPASLLYHASFQRPSEQLLKQLSQQLRKFVASAQQPNHSDDAVALAQGHSQGSAQLPCAAPGAALFPGELASSLPLSKGGVGLVHVPTQVQALQAKVISRLLEPERLAWKVFQLHHLSQASQVQPLGYEASILFSTLHTDQLQLPARLSAYVAAFRALHPHRLQSVSAMLPSDVLNEPLFFNRQISQPATSPAAINTACPAAAASFLTPQQKPLMLSAGITKVAHLRLSLQLQQPQLLALELNSVLLALPPAWRAVVSSAPAFTWFQVRSASGRQLIQDAQTGQLHTIGPHLQLQQVPLQPVLDPSPVQVISWDPSRPWRGPAHQSGQLGSHRYLQGPLWGQHDLSLGVWGWAVSQPTSWWSNRRAYDYGSSDLLPPSTHWPQAV